jgi:5'-nucleotidase
MTTVSADDRAEPGRRVFCNRTLNLRSIRAVGFDMDYTLIHYLTEAWERRAYDFVRGRLVARGWPLADRPFDPNLATLGLAFDLERGNLVKADRFGYVKRAAHGTRILSFDEQRHAYSRVLVDLEEPRWKFMNTLFALSEASLYAHAVELLDAKLLKDVLGYADLYRIVRASLDEVHMEGELKSEIVAKPDKFVELDPQLVLTLLDLKAAGKKLLLITNSDWAYTQAMMSYALERFLPKDTRWQSLFDIIMLSARKPDFFSLQNPAFEVVDAAGLLRPLTGTLKEGGVYVGGNAGLVEQALALSGDEILYVGDHIFADVHMSKSLLRWRTALVVREIEEELTALAAFQDDQRALDLRMLEKESLERRYVQARLLLQRREGAYGPPSDRSTVEVKDELQRLRAELATLDDRISPLARRASELANSRWGLLMRAGIDKSMLARQIERYADIYTSRVSNLVHCTPFAYLRAPRGSLPHDTEVIAGAAESGLVGE